MLLAALEKLELEMHSIARPLLPFLQGGGNEAEQGGASDAGTAAAILGAGDTMCRGALAMPPELPRRPPVYVLNPETLRATAERAGGRPDQLPEETICISLHGNNIRRIEGLGQYRALSTLVLSFNEIQRIEGLGELQALEHLDLSHNMVSRIEGLQGLNALHTLLLSHNLISVLEDVNVLKKYASGLRQLALDNNPMSRGNKAYRPLVLRRLGGLQVLDGVPVTEEELSQGYDTSCTLTVQMIRENCTFSKKSGWMAASMQERKAPAARAVGTTGGTGAGAAAPVPAASSGGRMGKESVNDEHAWRAEVQEIVLDHKKLRRVQNLEGFKKLKRIAFGNNELTKIQGLAECAALEEVSLEENRIAEIEGFGGNVSLRKIDLGKNRIQRIQNLGHLSALTQLSLEDNEISSLRGLSELTSLMELYIGNNRIATLKELNQIKGLPKLIIVDLLGNPLCGLEEYRFYTIYHLRKLKVLDGRGIEAGEVATAKQRFAGRLTLDFIEERLGDIVLQDLQELEITGARIRDISKAFAGNTFARLRELNLSSNFITDVACLRHLPNIAILVLNNNKLAGAYFMDPSLARLGAQESGVTLSPAAQQERAKRERSAARAFPNLEALYLGGNGIVNISTLGLAGLENLRVLHLHGNDIQRVEGLHGLPSLRELSLSKNRIKFVDPGAFSDLGTLRSLNLEENYLKQLSNFGGLTSLQRFQAGFNRISDLSDLEHLTALRSLSDLSLNNNPLARKQSYRQMAIQRCVYLKALDGKPVTAEERRYADMALDQSEASLAAQAAGGMHQYDPQGGAKVPIKVTSMNFEALVAPSLGGASLGIESLGVGIEVKRPPTLDVAGERPFRRPVGLYSGGGDSRSGSSGRTREGRSGSGRR